MLWAPVPEAPVDEYRNSCLRQDDIRSARKLWMDAEPQSTGVKLFT
jgi:hypothetical protein